MFLQPSITGSTPEDVFLMAGSSGRSSKFAGASQLLRRNTVQRQAGTDVRSPHH